MERMSYNRGGRRPPASSTGTVSASSIVEALKSMEKNPFSMNNAIPTMKGQSILDHNSLRMTGSLQRSINLEESSRVSDSFGNRNGNRHGNDSKSVGGACVSRDASGGPTADRKTPLDSYSRSRAEEFQKVLLSSTTAAAGAVTAKGAASVGHHQTQTRAPDNLLEENKKNSVVLSRQKDETFSKIRKIEKREEEIFQETIGIVPAHMLVTHGMFDMIKGKQLDKIMKLLFKMRLQLLGQGLAMWHKQAKVLTTALFGASAITVHRVARGFLARRRVKRLYKELLMREKNKDKRNAVAMMNREFKVTMIQSCIRRVLAVQVVQRERKHRQSIITVQRFYKKWKYQGRAKKTFELFILSHYSAKKIQRVWRGSQGRQRARHATVVRHRKERQDRYETTEGVFEFYFEQHGAAICIQKWYHSLPCVTELKDRARMAKRKKQLDVKIFKIQKLVRMFLMNKKMMNRWQEKKLKAKYNIRPRQYARIIKTQAAMRRFLAQRRNKALFADIMNKRERRRRALALGIVDHHRKTNRFENLKIGNLRNIVRLERKATIIQRWYKATRVLRYFYGMINNRRQLIADKIRIWFRAWRYRRQLKVSLFYIQPLWKRAVKKFLVRKYAQITISRKFKAYRAMKWFRDWRRMKNKMASRIQYCMVLFLKRRGLKAALARARFEQELLSSGEQLFDKTNIYNHIDEVRMCGCVGGWVGESCVLCGVQS
jgi:hypothetical protein